MGEGKGGWIRSAPLWVAACVLVCVPAGLRADPVNVAPIVGTATQSTTGWNMPASLAIDRNLGTISHTDTVDAAAPPSWWEVDLGMLLPIDRVLVQNRQSACCQERLCNIVVSVLDAERDPVWQSDVLNPNNALGFSLENIGGFDLDLLALTGNSVQGRIVRVERTRDTDTACGGYYVSLAEVETFVDSSAMPVMIDAQPQGATKYAGACHVFSVGVLFTENATTLGYQWFQDDVAIDGATGSRLILGDVQVEDGGVYRVEVTADGDTLVSNSAELVVKGLNLALTGTATQSSTSGGPAPRAIDGNTSGVWGQGSVTHTVDSATDLDDWWQVELYGDSTVERIVLWNRTDCCGERLTNFRVSLITTEIVEEVEEEVEVWGANYFEDQKFPTPSFTIDLPEPTECRIVRIQRLGPDVNGKTILSLAEVEVFGSGPLPPPPALPNLARACGAIASQSTTNGSYTAALAVDGNFGNFTHTVNSDQDPTWQVDLGAMSEIAIIRIYNRTSCCQLRLRDITVSILDDAGDLVWRSELLNPENVLGWGSEVLNPENLLATGAVLVQDLRVLVGGPVVGQIVRVVRTPNPDIPDPASADDRYVLSIGEVEVFGPPSWCTEEEGDTHCNGLTIEGPDGALPGTYVATASATDDSGDEILYTFTADNGVDTLTVVGPQNNPTASLELGVGTWTVSVTVDDDELCLDEADDMTCVSEAFDVVAPVGTNLALGGTATQTSEYTSSFPAPLANDDNLGNFTHTSEADEAPAWQVDLGEEGTLYAILIHNRDSCCGSRLRDITVSILDATGALVWESESLNPENTIYEYDAGPPVLTVDLVTETGGPVKGNVVRVARTPDPDLSGTDGQGNAGEPAVLSLGEVQVFGVICPPEGDTHCTGLTVEPTGESSGDTFEYLATATASDDSGDAVIYTFTASDGTSTITVGPQAESTALLDLTVGSWTVTVAIDDDPVCDDVAEDATCSQEVEVSEAGVGPFVRGDANADGTIDLSDGVAIFNYLFLGGTEPPCLAAADTNLQGEINLTSGVYLLNFLFLGGPEPDAPYPACGLSSVESDMTIGCGTPHPACNP